MLRIDKVINLHGLFIAVDDYQKDEPLDHLQWEKHVLFQGKKGVIGWL